MNLSWIDWLIMLVYFAFVLGIGFALKRYMRTSNDFFLAGRSIPAWVCGLAFISANLGAQEVIGMGASGADGHGESEGRGAEPPTSVELRPSRWLGTAWARS